PVGHHHPVDRFEAIAAAGFSALVCRGLLAGVPLSESIRHETPSPLRAGEETLDFRRRGGGFRFAGGRHRHASLYVDLFWEDIPRELRGQYHRRAAFESHSGGRDGDDRHLVLLNLARLRLRECNIATDDLSLANCEL